MGLMELVFNRPVDLLHKILDNRMAHSLLEEFFQRYGSGEAAAMCLLLAARLIPTEGNSISSAVAERAAEAFEDPRLVGLPQMQGSAATTSPVGSSALGFNMGQVVQEAIPIYSGAHEGLCLCTGRLLLPVWELPVIMMKGDLNSDDKDGGVASCRISVDAMQSLEEKLRALEHFLRARRNQRRGHYGRIFGVGDMPGFFSGLESVSKNLFDAPRGPIMQAPTPKRQRVPYSPAELSVMEVGDLFHAVCVCIL
jgi:nuclear pore complex protein Nup155